jgi:outer membrane lipoprotein-sorting protein
MDPGEFTSKVEMTVRRPGDEDRVYQMKMQGSGANKMLITFEYPPRDKGQAFLRVEDDMWMYLPSLNKTLRVPKREAFAGGDFNNHDMLAVRLRRDYNAERLADENADGTLCYCLKLTAKDASAPYASIRYWVAKENFWPVKRVFYTVGGQPFKTLIFQSKQPGERPDTFVMSNVMEKSKTTEMSWIQVKSVSLNPKIFSEAYLIRRR